MQALILAAGMGTRLKPLTDDMPKALVPFCGKPLIQHIIEKLIAQKFDEIIVNVHHYADDVIRFIESLNYRYVDFRISDESDELLDTGGGIRKALRRYGFLNPVLVHNVDIISNADLERVYEFHCHHWANKATLLVSKRESSRKLYFAGESFRGWVDKRTGEKKMFRENESTLFCDEYAFSGIQVISLGLLDKMREFPDKFSIIDFYLKEAYRTSIGCFELNNLKLFDVGTVESFRKAEEAVKNGELKMY